MDLPTRHVPPAPRLPNDAPPRLIGDAVQLRSVIDAMPALISYWDRDLRNLMANAAYLEWFGIPPRQMRGKHIREVLGDRLFELNQPHLRAVLAGEPQVFERRIVDIHGVARYAQGWYVPDIADDEVQGFFALSIDITERKRAEDALADETERMRSVLNAITEAVLAVDLDLRIDDINEAGCRMTGTSREDSLGVPLAHILRIEDHVQEVPVVGLCHDVMHTGSPRRRVDTDRVIAVDGGGTPVDWAISPLHSGGGEIRGALLTLRDVGGPRRLLAETQQRALHDPLTGLKNRRFLEQLHWRRHAEVGSTAAVVFFDLDGFKPVNDLAGHAAGDAVLVQVADELRHAVRESDAVLRIGGDEFAILLPDCTREEAQLVAQTVVDRVERRTFTWHGSTFHLGMSAGIGFGRAEVDEDVAELLRRADAACYEAKRGGGHRVAAG